MKLTEGKLRSIIREELKRLREVGLDGPFEKREIVMYDPDGFYETGGPAVVLSDRTVNAGGDYKIATFRAMKKYDDFRKYEQSVTLDDIEQTGVVATADEVDQLQGGTVPDRIKNAI